MATDPATLSGFVARFSMTGMTMGSGAADDTYVYGTGASFKDDTSTYTLSKIGNGFPQTTSRSGWRRLTQAFFRSLGPDGRFYNLGLPSISTRQVGIAFIGQHAAGAHGNNTPDAAGTAYGQALVHVGNALAGTDNGFGCGMDTTGRMANFQDGITSAISGTRIGCGTTSLIWGSGATGTYMKRLGFAGVTGAAYGAAAKSGTSIRLMHMNTDTSDQRWIGSDWDEILVYSVDDATMATYAPTIEAWAQARYGAVAPTTGTIIVCGTSRLEGRFGFGARTTAGYLAEALPTWDVINNGRQGYTLQNINTAAAALCYNSNDFPLGTTKPTIHVLDECSCNNINNGVDSASDIQTAYGTLCNTIKTNMPNTQIVVFTDMAIGATAVKENKRLAVRDWLLGGGLAAYGAKVYDKGASVPSMIPATPVTDGTVAAVTGSPSTTFQLYDNGAPPTASWDNVHYGLGGQTLIETPIKLFARAMTNQGAAVRTRTRHRR